MGTPSHIRGNPLGLHIEALARVVNNRCSTRHISPLHRFSITPATFVRASSPSLQQLLLARASPLLHCRSFFLPECLQFFMFAAFCHCHSILGSSLQSCSFSLFRTLKIFLFSLYLVVSPYSPSSFALQSPDCSGTFSSGCRHLSFPWQPFLPGVIIRTFCWTFLLHHLFLLVLRRLSPFQVDKITSLEFSGYFEWVTNWHSSHLSK